MMRPLNGIGRAAARLAAWCLVACSAALPALADTGAPAPADAPATAPPARPRIGLVLSGGGARGLAHVGVLKVLERSGVPIDVITGTSMGAIVGGLYASGMTASDIERELGRIDWNRIFDLRVDRQELSQRRKEEDFDVGSGFELGLTPDGEFRLPQGAVSSLGLETLLRRYTQPVRAVHDFDHLPIPFRAVATDMETGAAVVLDHGDLALALRSSMSVPGVFPPIELDGRMLGDGGLVDNLPVDVARAMGADVVIAVNIGTPLGRRETLNSVLGLTAQMITILTEQNVQRSLATLQADRDLLIAPDLGALTAADFAEAQRFIALGEADAATHAARLAAWALPPSDFARWLAQRRLPDTTEPALDFVAFAGTTHTNPARFEAQLRSQAGRAFDPEDAAKDARRLAASGDYLRADYRLVSTEAGATGLVFDLEDKPWGPNYLRVGLDLSTDFDGHSAFNIKLSHNRKWLTRTGTEWRNVLQVGEAPQFATEVYHPLDWTNGLSNDWFVAGWAGVERRLLSLYAPNAGDEVGQLRRITRRWGVDLGQTWGSVGEIRFGFIHQAGTTEPTLLSGRYDGPSGEETWSEGGLRTRVVIDQLDYAWFPQHGFRLEAEGLIGGKAYQETVELLARVEAEFTAAHTWGRHTLSVLGRVQEGDAHANAIVGQYTLGGFQQLSGYRPHQLAGTAVIFGRLNWYMRFAQPPVFARGLYVGATLEAGNAWAARRQMNLGDLRLGSSVYLGADTSIGPMFLGLTWAPEGKAGLALVIGRP